MDVMTKMSLLSCVEGFLAGFASVVAIWAIYSIFDFVSGLLAADMKRLQAEAREKTLKGKLALAEAKAGLDEQALEDLRSGERARAEARCAQREEEFREVERLEGRLRDAMADRHLFLKQAQALREEKAALQARIPLGQQPPIDWVKLWQLPHQTCAHIYPTVWHGTVPPPCSRCGVYPAMWATVHVGTAGTDISVDGQNVTCVNRA